MSVQFLKSSIPQENQSIKVNDCTVRGHSTIAEYLTVTGNVTQSADSTIGGILTMTGTALTGGKIKLPALTEYPQATATNANVAASTGGVAPEQFIIKTFETSPGVGGDLAAGASVSFNVFHSGVVANKTMILCSKAVSANTLVETNAWVSYTTDNSFIVTRHNFGATTAVGNEKLIFKLIQTA